MSLPPVNPFLLLQEWLLGSGGLTWSKPAYQWLKQLSVGLRLGVTCTVLSLQPIASRFCTRIPTSLSSVNAASTYLLWSVCGVVLWSNCNDEPAIIRGSHKQSPGRTSEGRAPFDSFLTERPVMAEIVMSRVSLWGNM
jgi:hypothetical protein